LSIYCQLPEVLRRPVELAGVKRTLRDHRSSVARDLSGHWARASHASPSSYLFSANPPYVLVRAGKFSERPNNAVFTCWIGDKWRGIFSLSVRGSGEDRGHLAIWDALRRRELDMSEQRDCERCGNPIPAARLGVLPNTRLCIECSEAIGGDYKTVVIAENTHGKSGSMKKNYGSWKVKRKLRDITPIDKE
jgi:hypothetical protein